VSGAQFFCGVSAATVSAFRSVLVGLLQAGGAGSNMAQTSLSVIFIAVFVFCIVTL